MRDVTKQVLLDVFITPFTVVPFFLGGTLLMLSPMLGGSASFFGFVGIALSAGAVATNCIFNLKKISQKAASRLHKQEKKRRAAELDQLDAKLVKNKDPRDQTALRNLRTLYNSFCDDLQNNKITSTVPPNMLQLIEDIFKECVHNLNRSYDIWKTAKGLQGDLKKKLLEQRENLVEDVESSVLTLAETINEVRALKLKTNASEMQRLRDKLTSQLRVAKATEESVAALNSDISPSYDEYDEYE